MKNKTALKTISAILVLIFVASMFTGCMGDPVDKTWFDEDNNTTISQDSLFPYDQVTTANAVISVGFDKIFGVSRALVRYRGEIPYAYSHDDDGNPYAGLESEPYTASYNGQEITQTSSHFSISWNEYWGPIALSEVVTPQELESVNEDAIISLRLYAWKLSTSKNWFFNIIYSITKGLSWLGSKLCALVIIIKNINIVAIMDALGLESLTQTINDIFLAKRDDAGHIISISPFAVFAIIAFIVSLVGFVISYVRGTKKEKSLWSDIVLLGIAGLLVIGIALSNNALNIGSWIADLSARLTQTVTELGGGSTYMWTTKTDNTGGNSPNISMELQNTETSIVNKILIDMQICAQFGVSKVDELDLTSLEDSETIPLAVKYLTVYYTGQTDVTPVDKNRPISGEPESNKRDKLVNRLGNNLGYYYWFATASQTNYGYSFSNTPKIFITNNRQADKLDQMITYLQALYNKARADNDTAKQTKILNILEHFAKPDPGANIVSMLILFIIYALLVICLFKYALKIVLAKLSLLAGILALPIAGILICTTNKNLVKTGKGLLGMFVMSFLRITIFSIFFDLVVYIVGALVSTDIVRLLITGVLLGLMWKLNPAIDKAIENALANIERTVAPEAREMKAQAKAYARRKISERQQKLGENNGKIVGYDEKGNAIRTTSRGGIYDQILRNADNLLTDDPTSRKSALKIRRESARDKQSDMDNARQEVIKSAENLRKKEYEDASSHTEDVLQDINTKAALAFDDVYDPETGEYDVSKLTGEGECADLSDINESQRILEDHINDDEYKALRKKKYSDEEFTEEEQAKYDEYKAQADKMQEEIYEKKVKFSAKVRSRINADVHREHACELREALERQQKASNNILAESGESIIKNGKNKTNYSQNLTEKDFTNAALIEKQLSELDRIEQGENISVGYDLTAEETKTAREEFDNYIKEEHLLGHGKIHKQRKSNDAMFDANVNRTIENKNNLRGDKENKSTNRRNRRRRRHDVQTSPIDEDDTLFDYDATVFSDSAIPPTGSIPSYNDDDDEPFPDIPEGEVIDWFGSPAPTDKTMPQDNAPSEQSHKQPIKFNKQVNTDTASDQVSNDAHAEMLLHEKYMKEYLEKEAAASSAKNNSVDTSSVKNNLVEKSSNHNKPIDASTKKQSNNGEPVQKAQQDKITVSNAESTKSQASTINSTKPQASAVNSAKPQAATVNSVKPQTSTVHTTKQANKYESPKVANVEQPKLQVDEVDYHSEEVESTRHSPKYDSLLEHNSPDTQAEIPLSKREQRRQARQERMRERLQNKEPYTPPTGRNYDVDINQYRPNSEPIENQYRLNGKPIDLSDPDGSNNINE